MLDADEQSYAALAERRRATALVTLVIALPIAITIMVIEYRLMLIALVLLTLPLVAGIEAIRTARARDQLRRCRLRFEPDGLVIEAATTTKVPAADLIVRAQPDALILVEAKPPAYRWFYVPFTPPAADGILNEFKRLGVKVFHERQIVPTLVGVFLGVFASLGLGKVAAVMVMVSVAIFGRYAFTQQGEPLLGMAFLGGAIVALVLKSLAVKLGFSSPNR